MLSSFKIAGPQGEIKTALEPTLLICANEKRDRGGILVNKFGMSTFFSELMKNYQKNLLVRMFQCCFSTVASKYLKKGSICL